MSLVHGWDGPFQAAFERLLNDFSAAVPGVQVESQNLDSALLRDTLVASSAGGTAPDVIMLRSDSAAYFADARLLRPLDDLLTADGVRSDLFKPDELAARSWDGHLYGLPHVAAGAEQLLFVNLGLLERLGGDPAEPLTSLSQVEELVEPARRIGALALDPTRCGSSVPGLQVWTYVGGGRWTDEAARRITWAEAPAVRAADAIRRVVASQQGSAGLPPIPEPWKGPLSVQEWATERHVCCINDANWIARLEQEAPQVRFAVYELPAISEPAATARRAPSFGGWMLSISRDARNEAAAWELLKFATLSAAAELFAGTLGRPSPLTTPVTTASPNAGDQAVRDVVAQAQAHSVLVPALPISAQLDDLALQVQATILTTNQPTQPLLESAARTAQQLLDTWSARRRRP